MLLGDHGLFDGVHAADRRTIGIVTLVQVPRAHTLEPGDFFWFLVVRTSGEVAARGARSRQDTLHLDGGNHIGQGSIAVIIKTGGIERLKTGGEDHRADIEDRGGGLLFEINRFRGTEFFTGAAFAVLLKINTGLIINGVFQWHGLGIFHVGGFALGQPRVVGVGYLLGALFSAKAAGDTFLFVNIPGLAGNFDLEISGRPLNFTYFTERFQLDVQMPADLDQFR